MVGLLGRGGMGEVYRADDLKLGQPVALKFLPRDVERDPERLERFLNEVRLSLRVTHPNVCRVFDIGQIEDPRIRPARLVRHFLSMEYVDGEDLASLLRRIGRLPEDKAVEIARQLCAGLAAAHDEGVLHRDLKPANVMIDGRGRAKITDFGLAGATAGISGREAQAGTPQYMAPEQVAGGELSERTDIYSLGLVLYEMFTGKRAFDAKDLARSGATAELDADESVGARQRPRTRSSSARFCAASIPIRRSVPRRRRRSPRRCPAAIRSRWRWRPVKRRRRKWWRAPAARASCVPPSPSRVSSSFLAGLVASGSRSTANHLENRVAMPKPPVELAIAARAVLAAAGYTRPPAASALGFDRDASYFDEGDRGGPFAAALGQLCGLSNRRPSGSGIARVLRRWNPSHGSARRPPRS